MGVLTSAMVFKIPACAILVVRLGSAAFAQVPAPVAAREASQVYAQFCADCHGQKLEGGKAGSLLDNIWKHGGSATELMTSIQHGFPLDGMPAFSPAMSDAEIHAMVEARSGGIQRGHEKLSFYSEQVTTSF